MYISKVAEVTLNLSKTDLNFLKKEKFCEVSCRELKDVNGMPRYFLFLGENIDNVMFNYSINCAKELGISSELLSKIEEAKKLACAYLLILNDNYTIL